MSTSRLALEKERLNVQSKAKFDSTRHKNKSEDPNAELMVCLDIFLKRTRLLNRSTRRAVCS